jgi:protein-S-isoprenylcysteine O-methyltransferase Ste14
VILPGLDRLAAHVPELRSLAGFALIALIALSCFSAATAGMLVVDHVAPAWSGAAQLGAIGVAAVLVGGFFRRRAAYRERWGDLAYRNAFARHVLTALPVLIAALLHTAWLPGRYVVVDPWSIPIAVLVAWLLVSGFVLWLRAIFTFGFDNLAMLYVYVPHEGRMVESSIYGVIRHPAYSGVMQVVLALALARGTWFSIAFGLLMPAGMTIHLRLFEERELLERFGTGYAEYRRRTPAFWPHPRDVGRYLRFLAAGG